VEYEPDADRATALFNAEGVDLIVAIELAYQKGAIPMRTLLRVHAPILVWNTQQIRRLPDEADFDLIMENSGMAGLPELTSGLLRSNRRFELLTSHIDDPRGLEQIGQYAAAAGAARRLERMRIGVIGHPFEGMTDLMVDYLSLLDKLGRFVGRRAGSASPSGYKSWTPARAEIYARAGCGMTPARCLPSCSTLAGWRWRCWIRPGKGI
jgi:L-fucose isomerase-like protein